MRSINNGDEALDGSASTTQSRLRRYFDGRARVAAEG